MNKKTYRKFWAKVAITTADACWLWTGAKNKDGYGNFSSDFRTNLSHRISYFQYYGSLPKGKLVLHKCDVPACVNPDHLFLGTQRDNVYDCIKKNRRAHLIGEKHGRAKLTEKQARLIKGMYEEFRVPKKVLSEWTGVTDVAINLLIKGKNWSHLCV